MKTYSNKSNAKRSAVKQGLENFEIVKVEGGFAINVDVLAADAQVVHEAFAEVPAVEVEVKLNDAEQELVKSYGHVNCPHCDVYLGNGVGLHGQIVNGTRIKHDKYEFECLGCGEEFGDVVTKNAPRSAASGKGLKIEANREERNGIKRPSVGGVCRAVWDECDAYMEANGKSPKPSNLKDKAVAEGWNLNNVSIELYQWRKFNGISGR